PVTRNAGRAGLGASFYALRVDPARAIDPRSRAASASARKRCGCRCPKSRTTERWPSGIRPLAKGLRRLGGTLAQSEKSCGRCLVLPAAAEPHPAGRDGTKKHGDSEAGSVPLTRVATDYRAPTVRIKPR